MTETISASIAARFGSIVRRAIERDAPIDEIYRLARAAGGYARQALRIREIYAQ